MSQSDLGPALLFVPLQHLHLLQVVQEQQQRGGVLGQAADHGTRAVHREGLAADLTHPRQRHWQAFHPELWRMNVFRRAPQCAMCARLWFFEPKKNGNPPGDVPGPDNFDV